jgi:transposase-like protein
MAQHHSLSAAATRLSIGDLYRMSDDEAHAVLVQMRWPDGLPHCPHCGHNKLYAFSNKRTWKCAKCRRKFSVTSGFIFHGRKLSYQQCLVAVAHFVHGVLGVSALRLRRELAVSYKTAFALGHKMREVMGHQIHSASNLSGIIEIDGAYFGAMERRKNMKAERDDQRSPETKAKKLAVISARERWGRMLVYVMPREADAWPLLRQRIEKGSTIHADSANEWNRLVLWFPMMRVNHSIEMVSADGASVNWCESYNRRLKDAEYGVYRRIFGHFLQAYSNELAWREDHRFENNEVQWGHILTGALNLPKSRVWCGYWQPHRCAADFCAVPGVAEVLAVKPEYSEILARLILKAARWADDH